MRCKDYFRARKCLERLSLSGVTFAQHITGQNPSHHRSLTSSSLDRSYEYDNVGRLAVSHAGAEARAHTFSGQWGTADGHYSQGYDYDVWGNLTHRYGWGGEVQQGSPASSTDLHYAYANGNNRRTNPGFTYDAAGNLTFDGGQHFTYDAQGNQVGVDWMNIQQGYDGDGRRVRRSATGTAPARYLRSSVLGGQVVAELNPITTCGSGCGATSAFGVTAWGLRRLPPRPSRGRFSGDDYAPEQPG